MGKNIFSKLESQIKTNKISESALTFRTDAEKRLFESQVIFGGIVDELAAANIEEAYVGVKLKKKISEAEDPMAAASQAQDQAQEAQAQARKQVQAASIERQMKTLEDRSKSQMERLRDRKEKVMGVNESEQKTAANAAFFTGKDGGILNYLVNGELAFIDPELKALAKKFRNDEVVRDLAAKAKAQLQSETPNMDLLKIIKYKIVSRIEMLERLLKEREGQKNEI
jgi:hypothetical protein